jgi:outer membrane protein assembly factor BamB
MVPALSRRRLLTAAGTLAATAAVGAGGALAQSSPVSNGAWPMAQRDPAGTCHAPDATPPKDDVAVRWKRPADPDRGFVYGTPPVVADGRVYVVGDDLQVLDAKTGAVRFRDERGFRSAPAVAPARAYHSPTLGVVGEDGAVGLHANGGVDLFGQQAGLTRWTRSATDEVRSLFGGAEFQPPPVAAGQTLLFSTAGELFAVDASSGRVRWRRDVDASRPVVHDGTVYAADYGEGIFGYDLASGDRESRWRVSGTLVLGLTAGPEQLVVATDDGLAGVTYDGTTRWRFEPDALYRDRGAVALADDVAYGGFRGEEEDWLVAVDTADGTEVWRSPAVPESTPQFAPPAVANDTVYVPAEDQGLVAVDANDGSIRWRFDTDDLLPFSPAALVGDACYVLGPNHVYALAEP